MFQVSSSEKLEEAKRYLDYRDVKELPKEESDEFPVIYVFRHGQTHDNANYIFSGWRESKLTKKGEEQALVLADKLKGKKIDGLISSPQVRAIETMKLAISKNENVKKLTIETDERIKERSYGDLTGKSKLKIYLEDLKRLKEIRRSYNFIPENGESIEMVCKRVEEFIEDLIKSIKGTKTKVAISCNGNSIRGFRKHFEHLSNEETAEIETPLGQDYAAYVIKD